ncbi:hypothetical protein [Micromonospora sp. NBC_01638]|uniref:hypothetical protein n=1 Tax=Micromonospora sp. NBC_01638 TaxID=2975982 RepID=UPI00386DF142|nr:hypothetical protein OG811_31955 [Micromonospora sp. NBC_01638]
MAGIDARDRGEVVTGADRGIGHAMAAKLGAGGATGQEPQHDHLLILPHPQVRKYYRRGLSGMRKLQRRLNEGGFRG